MSFSSKGNNRRDVTVPGHSTTTPLLAGASFTGNSALDLEGFGGVRVEVLTDQPGVCWFEWSQDGTNWDDCRGVRVFGSEPLTVHSNAHGKYFRTHFVNNPNAPQGTFRLSTTLTADPQSHDRPENLEAVASGRVPGYFTRTVTGVNDAVTTTESTVWPGPELAGGDARPLLPVVPTSLAVASESANDDFGTGNGAHALLVQGLDSLGNPHEEVVLLTGTTPVNLSGTWFAVNGVFVVGAGSDGKATGPVWVGVQGSFTSGRPSTGNQLSVLKGVANQALGAFYTVPLGALAVVRSLSTSNEATKTFKLRCKAVLSLGLPFVNLDTFNVTGGVQSVAAEGFNETVRGLGHFEWTGVAKAGTDSGTVKAVLLVKAFYSHNNLPTYLP